MKTRSRLTALLLALVMALGTAAPALATTIDLAMYQQLVNDAQVEPVIDEGGEVYDFGETAEEAASGYDVTSEVTLAVGDGEQDVALPVNGKLLLTSAIENGQWQVQVGDMWVNMHGETGSTLEVTYAKVQSLFVMNNSAKIRHISADGAQVSCVADIGLDYSVQTLEEDVAMPMMFAARRSVDGNAGIALAAEGDEEEPDLETVVVEIAYQYQDGTTAATSYTATIGKGSDLTTSVIQLPYVVGYVATFTPMDGATFVAPGEGSNGTIQLSLENVTDNLEFVVTYVPTNVEFKVEHYLMGFDAKQETAVHQVKDDQIITSKKTNDPVGEGLGKTYDGFRELWYDSTTKVAADGTTVIKIYYEREWYLMLFELDGGYGVDPIYAQYGAAVESGTPTKPGYGFTGWEPAVPDTVPAGGGTYEAQWNANTANYTVVYWKENADDNGYTFWGSEIKSATPGSKVSGADTVPQSVHGGEKQYFTFNEGRTDKNITIAGDGSSVVNVYYLRNYYTIYFMGYGTCALEAHTHSDACRTMICGYTEEHTHDKECGKTLVCKIAEHSHSSTCCTLSTAAHTHTTSCYSSVNVNGTVSSNDLNDAPPNPVDGQIYQYDPRFGTDGRKLIYISGKWYRYSGNRNSGSIVEPNNNCPGTHTHGDGKCTCSQTVHAHGDACYTYECGKTVHKHSTDCYRDCLTPEHTHSYTCNSNNSSNTIYVITAKYEQTIGDIWPTYDVLKDSVHAYKDNNGNVENNNNQKFRGWSIEGFGQTEQVSKCVTMTADLCDTNDGAKNATAQYGGTYTYRLYYMFESFDQESEATEPDTDGNARRSYTSNNNRLWYDSDPVFYQELNYNSDTTFNQKTITGMNAVGREKETTGQVNNGNYLIYNYLYYTRNRSALRFQNIDTVVKTVTNVMYEQPLADYTDSQNNLLRDFEPEYPSTLEPNAYEFEGWYTTPECYEGTKFDFATATMPNGDLTLYAHWEPVVREVAVYIHLEDIGVAEPIVATFEVAHGAKVPEDTFPTQEYMENLNDYTFVGWFYQAENEDGTFTEKAFDPNNMPVRSDLNVYAKWSMNNPINFKIYYRLQDANGNPVKDADDNYVEVAAPLEGRALYGTTVTVEAKTGNDLYEGYRTGFFPHPPSHSVVIQIAENEDDKVNEYVFWYTEVEAVPYRVMYVAYEDGQWKEVAESKYVENNVNTVVTENYVRVPGYMPDEYQKRLIVAYNGNTTDDGDYTTQTDENIIFFYYVKDEVNAFYTVTHYIEPIGGVRDDAPWQRYGVEESYTGVINQSYTAVPHDDLTGFTYQDGLNQVDKYDEDGLKTELTGEDATLEQVLTAGGMDFRLYYSRNEYPVKVKYLEQGTDAVLADAELYMDADEVTAFDYQSQVQVTTDKSFHGYELAGSETQKITINVDGTTLNEIEKNIVTFYYKKAEVEINYVGVAPDGTLIDTDDEKQKIGSVTPEAEPGTDGVVTALDGPVAGSTAAPASTSNVYKFAGWYLDAACTQAVPTGWVDGNNKITPQPQDTDNDATTAPLYVSATFYAKFEYNLTSLTIVKDGYAETASIDPNQTFIFRVTGGDLGTNGILVSIDGDGSKIISGLTVGETYTVTEMESWSWRYDSDSSKSITLQPSGNTVTITNTRDEIYWLDGNAKSVPNTYQ